MAETIRYWAGYGLFWIKRIAWLAFRRIKKGAIPFSAQYYLKNGR